MQRATSRERKGTLRQARVEVFVFAGTTKGVDREHAVGWEIGIKSTDTEQHSVFPPCLVFEFLFRSLSLTLPPYPSPLFLRLLLSAGEERKTIERERGEQRQESEARETREGREGEKRVRIRAGGKGDEQGKCKAKRSRTECEKRERRRRGEGEKVGNSKPSRKC